jgi:hypothetical protein
LDAGSVANGGQILLRDLVNTSSQFIQLDGNTREVACLDLLSPNQFGAVLSPSNLNCDDGATLDRSNLSASRLRVENIASSSQTDITNSAVSINIPQPLGQATFLATVSNPSTGENCSDTDATLATALVGNKTYTSDATPSPLTVSNHFYQINATNAIGGYTYNDNTPSANITNFVQTSTTASTAFTNISSSSGSGINVHSLKLETPVSGDAVIAHTVTAGARNLGLTTTGNLLITSDNLNSTADTLTVTSSTVGGQSNPLLVLQNNTTTGGPNNGTTFETYKNDTPTSTGGDTIGTWSATCNTNVGKTEIARINQIAYGVGASNNDGGIALACKVNSTVANFLVCNGGVGAGEVQIFKPITNPSGDITVSTTSSSGTGTITLAPNAGASVLIPSETDPTNDFISINPQIGANAQRVLMTATDGGGFTNSISLNNSQYAPSIELKADFGSPERSITISADGNAGLNSIVGFDSQANAPLLIDTSGYTGGSIELKVNSGSGSLKLTSSSLESNTSTGSAGKYLVINLNGTDYKIALENP